ncbi:hypothetical protein C6A85_15740, partial [Mycobacterium sp. ITM-2017-0098]
AVKEYAEQTAVTSRKMYASPNRRTSHRLAALDVAVPFWMRAPVGGGIHFARRDRGLLGVFLDRRSLFDGIVHDRREMAAAVG